MMKLKNRKGFTLAELLIVVAIVAVLVAISIPVFTSKLEKSREATDVANMRAAKAAAVAEYLAEEDGVFQKETGTFYYDAVNGIITTTQPKPYGKGTIADGKIEYEGYKNTTGGDYTKQVIQVAVDTEGKVTLTWVNGAGVA